MQIIIQSVACMSASVAFGVLIRQPKNTLLYTGLIGLNGYLLFLLCGEGISAYFWSGFLVGLLCEWTARIRKMASTLFLIGGIIPLVPGLGLYRSMMALSQKQYELAASSGVKTLLSMLVMVIAITFSSLIFSNIRKHRKEKR